MFALIFLLFMFGIPAGMVMLIAEVLINYSRNKEARAKLENLIPRRDTSKDTSFPDLQNTVGGKRQDKAGTEGNKQYTYTYTSNGTPVKSETVTVQGSTNKNKWQVNEKEKYARPLRKKRAATIAAAACFVVSGVTFFDVLTAVTEGISIYGFNDLTRYADTIPTLLISIVFLIAGLWIVISRQKKIDKENKYIAIINQGYGMIPIDNIAHLYPKKYDACVQDLQEMINNGTLGDAYIDYGRRLLVIDPNNSSVEPLIVKNGAGESSGKASAQGKSTSGKKAPAKVSEADHVDFLSLERLSRKVRDEDIKMKLMRISSTLKTIGQKAEEDPSIRKDGGVDQFMEMYLPKTIRLVEEYEEVDRAADLPDDNELKKNILETLDAIDNAAMTLWKDIIHSDMIDISTELSALQTKLVMDGYSESDFKSVANKAGQKAAKKSGEAQGAAQNKAASGAQGAPQNKAVSGAQGAPQSEAKEKAGSLPELTPERPAGPEAIGEDIFSKIRKEQEKTKETLH